MAEARFLLLTIDLDGFPTMISPHSGPISFGAMRERVQTLFQIRTAVKADAQAMSIAAIGLPNSLPLDAGVVEWLNEPEAEQRILNLLGSK
jgi:hypothetical protein